jgi:hypothetical protein
VSFRTEAQATQALQVSASLGGKPVRVEVHRAKAPRAPK